MMPGGFAPSWPELFALIAVTLIAGLLRGFTGFGAGMVMAPLFSLILGPLHAVPVLVALELVAGARLLPEAWGSASLGSAARLALPACITIPFGAVLLGALSASTVRRVIAILVLAIVLLLATGYRRRRPVARPQMIGAGALSGLLSGFAGIGGPPIVLLLLSGSDGAARNRSTLIVYFAATQVVATLVFALRGWIDMTVLWALLILSPVFLVGIHTGARLFNPDLDALYRRVALVVLALAALPALP
jgi:uncharacterized membrane protein YfcA